MNPPLVKMTATEPVSASDDVLNQANPIASIARAPIKFIFLIVSLQEPVALRLLRKTHRRKNAKTPCGLSFVYDAALNFGAAARGLPFLASASVVTSFRPSAAS